MVRAVIMSTAGKLAVLIFLVLLHETKGTELDCGPGGEAREGSDHTLTCDGIQDGQAVAWIKTAPVFGDITVASCTDASSCQSNFTSKYDVTRPSNVSSTLKILDVERDDTYVEGEWTCASATSSAACYVTVIYAPDIGECVVGFDEMKSQVNGRCEMHKVYPRPTCSWYQTLQGNETQIPSSQTSLTLTQYVDASNHQIYFRATCELHSPLPTAPGTYSYKVIITPGLVEPQITYTTTTVVAFPAPPTLRNCPQDYVTDADVTSCTCVTTDLGSPQGSLEWYDPSNSIVLRNTSLVLVLPFSDVTSESNGETFRCAAVHHTGSPNVSYTPKIAVRFDKPVIAGYDASAEYKINSLMNLVCSASGGQPGISRVVFECPGHPDQPDRREGDKVISRLTFTLKETDNNVLCVCSASNRYFMSDNVTQTIRVHGSPTRDDHTELSEGVIAAIVSGAAFLVVVVVVVVVVCWYKRTKEKAGDKRPLAPKSSQASDQNHSNCQSLVDDGGHTTSQVSGETGRNDIPHMTREDEGLPETPPPARSPQKDQEEERESCVAMAQAPEQLSQEKRKAQGDFLDKAEGKPEAKEFKKGKKEKPSGISTLSKAKPELKENPYDQLPRKKEPVVNEHPYASLSEAQITSDADENEVDQQINRSNTEGATNVPGLAGTHTQKRQTTEQSRDQNTQMPAAAAQGLPSLGATQNLSQASAEASIGQSLETSAAVKEHPETRTTPEVFSSAGRKLSVLTPKGKSPQTAAANKDQDSNKPTANIEAAQALAEGADQNAQASSTDQSAQQIVTEGQSAQTPVTGDANGEKSATEHQSGEKSATEHQNGEKSATEHQNGEKSATEHQNGEKSATEHQNGEKSAAEHQNGEKSATEHQNGEKSATEHQNGEKSATEDENGEKSATEDENGEKSATEHQNGEKSATEHQNGEKSATEHQNGEKSATEHQNGEKSATEHQNGEKSATEHQNGEKSATEHQNGEKSATEHQNGEKSATEHQNGEKSATEHQNGEKSATEHQNGEKSATEDENGEKSATEHQNGEKSATDHQNGEKSATEDENGEKSATEHQNGEKSATEDQHGEKSATEDQNAQTPATEDQNAQTPASEGQNAHRPVTEVQDAANTSAQRSHEPPRSSKPKDDTSSKTSQPSPSASSQPVTLTKEEGNSGSKPQTSPENQSSENSNPGTVPSNDTNARIKPQKPSVSENREGNPVTGAANSTAALGKLQGPHVTAVDIKTGPSKQSVESAGSTSSQRNGTPNAAANANGPDSNNRGAMADGTIAENTATRPPAGSGHSQSPDTDREQTYL